MKKVLTNGKRGAIITKLRRTRRTTMTEKGINFQKKQKRGLTNLKRNDILSKLYLRAVNENKNFKKVLDKEK